MAYTPTAWTTGDAITATKLNTAETQYREALKEFGGIFAHVRGDSETSLGNAYVGLANDFGWVYQETGYTVTTNDRLFVPANGTYWVTHNCFINDGDDNTKYFNHAIYKNAALLVELWARTNYAVTYPTNIFSPTGLSVLVAMTTSDYLRFQVTYSGTGLSTRTDANHYYSTVTAQRIA